MAKIATVKQTPSPNRGAIRGEYIPGNSSPVQLKGDLGVLGETIARGGAQAAAFLLLNIPKPQRSKNNQFQSIEDRGAYQPDSPDRTSALGTPVYGSITLGDGDADGRNTYTDAQGVESFYRTVQIDCALVNIGFNPKVIKTDIQGLPQTIKEFISSGDNDVNITGIFNSTPGVAPMDFIINMSKLFAAPVPIPVTNYYLNANNIYYICIMPGTTMGQMEGEYATQRFTIVAISDVPMTEMLP